MSNHPLTARPTQDRQGCIIMLSPNETKALHRLLVQALGHRVIDLPTGDRNLLWSVLDEITSKKS